MSHRRIATVATPSVDAAVAAIQASSGCADAVEIRLDSFWTSPPSEETATDTLLALTAAADSAGMPLLATLRPVRQGGRFEGPEEVRVGLLLAAAKSGFTAVDLEADMGDPAPVVRLTKQDAQWVVLSDHRFAAAPSKDRGLMALQAMQDCGADLQKLAFPAGSFADTLRAIELNRTFAAVHGAPAVQPIGAEPMVRALLPLAGCAATYGHAPGVPPAVSGQPGLEELQAIWTKWGLQPSDFAEPRNEWIAVVGEPVGHSLSPAIHNAALRAAGRAERYGALTVPNSMGAVRLLFGVAARIGMVGAGVTAPLKVHAFDASTPDDAGRAVGAVNTVRFRGDAIESTNTDVIGLQRLMAAGPTGDVLVLGAGGAARAAIHAANQLGRAVRFTSRDPERAGQVASDLGAQWIPWTERAVGNAAIVVQCTSLGTKSSDASPLDSLGGCDLLIEMVYAGGPTALERMARANGIPVHDGVDVLLNQAADQYRFWTGQEPDAGAMRGALQQ